MDEDQVQAPVVDATEDKEWEQAAEDFSKGVDPIEKKEEPKDDKVQEDGGKDDTEPKETPEEKAEAEKPKEEPKVEDNPVIREQRAVQREIAEDQKAMKEDIRKEMFGDVPTQLLDADGDPIRTIADMQKLLNPNTQKPFTEEEAAAYLFQAQKHLEEQLKEVEQKVDSIAEVNLSIKDQSDNVRTKYGGLLNAMPDLRKAVWAEFEKTLKKDEKSGIIIEAPVSLERFYDIALQPYANYAAKLKKEDAQRQAEEDKKQQSQDKTDRTDIFSGGKSDTKDAEEKEWEAAAKVVYQP
jgi:hypothetical protein